MGEQRAGLVFTDKIEVLSDHVVARDFKAARPQAGGEEEENPWTLVYRAVFTDKIDRRGLRRLARLARFADENFPRWRLVVDVFRSWDGVIPKGGMQEISERHRVTRRTTFNWLRAFNRVAPGMLVFYKPADGAGIYEVDKAL